MMKISALNEESSEESDEENTPTITKEAQEQIALTEYNKALELLKEGKIDDALNIFKDLLDTELLDQVEKPQVPDGRTRPMLSLKYCCYKNIGAIYTQLEKYDDAIDNYWEAANLDDSDVTLWYRMGTLAMKTYNLEFACSAFKYGLKCNPNHWPCLDNIITAMYAIPDYMNCLIYISMALEKDPSYIKGLAFREKIYKDIPYFEESYKLFNSNWALDPPMDTEFDRIIGDELIADAKVVAQHWIEICKSDFEYKPLPILSLNKPLKNYTWLELGESLIDMHNYISEKNLNFISKIQLDVQKVNVDQEQSINQDTKTKDNEDEILIDISSELDSVNDTEMEIKLDNDNSEVKLENGMQVDIDDDEKSSSSEVHIIDFEDPSKLDAMEMNQDEAEGDVKLQDKEIADTVVNKEGMKSGKSPTPNQMDVDVTEKSTQELNDKIDGSDQDGNEKNADKTAEKSVDKTSKPDDKANERVETKDEQQKVKKRRRSSLCFLQQWAWSSSSTRRSTRVRGSNRREAEREDVLLEETLRRILPSTLLPDTAKVTKDDPLKSVDDSMDTMDLYQLFANQDNNFNNDESKSTECSKSPCPETNQNSKYFESDNEKSDVLDFINEHSGKSNMMIIIARYTEFLSQKWNYEWPAELTQIYLQAYSFTREHIPHSSPFNNSEDSVLNYDAEMTLLYGELHTDRWLISKPDNTPPSTIDTFGTGMPSEELGYILFSNINDDQSNVNSLIFLIRVLWVKTNLFLCQGDIDVAIKTLQHLLAELEDLKDQFPEISIKLPNCKYNSYITMKKIQKRLRSIERGQKLGQVQKLYENKKYVELFPILQDTFKFNTKQSNDTFTNVKTNVDRIQQLYMLLDSLWQLEKYEDCFVWAESCLNEAWQCYINSSLVVDQEKWSVSVLNCLEKLELCIDMVGTSIIRYLSDTKAPRLVQTLVQIICHQADVSDNVTEMPLETITPWILLHHILQYEDDKERAKTRSPAKSKATDIQESDSDDEDKDIPVPIMILFTGHDFLARHTWCCIKDAKLLLFTIKTVVPRMCGARYNALREKIGKHLEQIFWCLYGHPNRPNRTKPKHIEDHGVQPITLTWEIAQLLFEFYKPETIPEFDTPRAYTISVDTKILFKRISTLVPKEHDPSPLIDEITAYITGDAETMPMIKKPLPYQVELLYYLLGDYAFKNNNWLSSIRYFTMEVCLHPNSFISWVPLAMSMGTVIGTSLNNCKPLTDITKLLSQAKIAQCCYRQAVEIKPGHSIIWIEYGNFVYMVHSFCSRLLKQESDTLSMEKFAILETRKEEMLELAENCFHSANRIYLANIDDAPQMQDERWLYHYMLAKISEKKNEDPPVFLEHYATASELLHKNNAHYPKRISHKSAHYLSIEALEVHYRIHACILKYLEQHEGKPLKKSLGQLFLKHLLDCAGGPFMQFQSKLNRNKRKENLTNGVSKVITKESSENLIVESIPKSRTVTEKRQNSVEEISISAKIESTKVKNDNRKRIRESGPEESSKRAKVENISLMKDVLGLVDDLITKVCNITDKESKDTSSDEVMVISSDESESSKVADQKSGDCGHDGKSRNDQDIMDALMKETMELSQALHSSQDGDDSSKMDGKWLQNDDLQAMDYTYLSKEKECKEKSMEKKKSQVNTVKDEATMSRRGSQESTTTTLTTSTTETNNSSYSSSDESSSSDDSSDSDSSSAESDSESDSDAEKKKVNVDIEEKEEYVTESDVAKLISYCLAGLEQCVLRFPEHYKSIYRLCHFYFNHKSDKDNDKCRDLLLGTYKCQYYHGLTFQGLFADRKTTNFFNGVWRIPNEEIDRPGSFASHMSRCVTLLMQVLKETDDSRMLMELCIQLRKTPDTDKKYVRDSEREQLSRQALTLCLQSLRTRVQSMGPPRAEDSALLFRTDSRTHVLLDVYKIYQQVLKNFQGKEVQAFATLLVDTYKTYMGLKVVEGNVLEVAIRCCQQQTLANKIAATHSPHTHHTTSVQSTTAAVTTATTVTVTQSQPVTTAPQVSTNKKPSKSTGTGRPRGRPPNINKHLQGAYTSNLLNQFNVKRGFNNFLPSSSNPALMNPYFMNSLLDQNMMSAMLASGLSGNRIDPLAAAHCLSQISGYQDILRQYQNNLSSISNLANYGNLATSMPNVSNVSTMSASNSGLGSMPSTSLGNLGSMNLNPTIQQLLNMNTSTSSTTTSSVMYPQPTAKAQPSSSLTKDMSHGISITPVSSSMQHKAKPSLTSHMSKTIPTSQPSKSLQSHHSTPQVSLLKPSVAQQARITPPKQISAPQIRVSKSLTEPQPAHSASLSPLKNTSPSNLVNLPQNLQNPGLNITPVPTGMVAPRSSGTSLQHKLQLKKQAQQLPLPNPTKKHRQSTKLPKHSNIAHDYPNLLSMSGAGAMSGNSYMPPELSGLSLSTINQPVNQKIPPMKAPSFRKTNKGKSTSMEMSGSQIQNSLSSASSAETFNMLSQLQQHSHLEIIPQSKISSKSNVDYAKNTPLSLSIVPPKSTENLRSVNHEAATAASLEMPRAKSNNSPKKVDKHAKDNVEIITLDD